MSLPVFEPLDPDKIKLNLNTKRIGRKILVYNRTSSTNDIARRYARDKCNDGTAIFAEEQTAGRGRAGNKWLSKRSDSIICSILLIDNVLNAELLSLTFAVATAEAIGKQSKSRAKIKWPNDIMLSGKKVAGILLEATQDNNENTYIIGIGLNCHQKKSDFPAELQDTATSIDIENSSVVDRIALAKRLLVSTDHWLEKARQSKQKVIDRWSSLSILLGHRVTLLYNGKKFAGNCTGIDPEKGLILHLDSGGVRMFDAAHTSIAK
ncbi:MAG: biotin--[acetyl-CoA-carboxylase] ligase [Sedimentisphaerales bacterium]|nr:biotin--[acetyl-CoA-carboxylase] ligase [Sedimentisphaerales bacterium]